MAIIEITVDTSKKTVVAKVDNKKISNVHDIHVFTETSGFFGVDIAQVEDVGDLKKITRLVANKEDGAKIVSKAIESLQYFGEIDYIASIKYLGEENGLSKFEIVKDTVTLEDLLDKA